MTDSLVSIIIPCYNQAQFLPETLDSVLAQTYPYWECIIVNDGSLDNTELVIKQYCEKDKRFKYLYKTNGGLSSARNAGVKNSSGEFILPLDSDDLIGEHYLEKGIKHFQNFKDTKLVYCKVQLFGNEVGEWKLPDYNYSVLLFENIIFCSAIYKRFDYNRTSGYNENFINGFEDWDFWLSLINEMDVVYRLPEICFFYRIRDNSMLRNLTQEIGEELRREIYENHKEKYEKYVSNIIWLNYQQKELKNSIEFLNHELLRVRSSKAYRFGKLLLKPLSFFNNMWVRLYSIYFK